KGFSLGAADQFRINQYVEEFAFKYKGLSLQEEFHWKDIEDRKNGRDFELKGMYAQAGYFLNGFIPQVPKNIELAVRYAFVEQPDDSNISLTNNRDEYSVALNYFFAGHNNKVTVDYSYLSLDDASSGRFDSVNRIRVQWDISF
ncbi:MAG: porin, partial [Nitrospinales bacterium]